MSVFCTYSAPSRTHLPRARMVLLWRYSDPSTILFDRTSDIRKFFFYYENVAVATKSDEEKARKLLFHLQGSVFDLYYDRFVENGSLAESAEDYSTINKAFLENFDSEEEAQEVIRQALAADLAIENLSTLLRDIDRL